MLLTRKTRNQLRLEKQKGVTLLLSILILSAITAIVFSIAAISLNEIRTSGDLTRTEPIIKAVEGLAEDSLFKSVRGFTVLSNCSSPTLATLGPVNISTCASYYYSSPYAFGLTAGSRRDFYLYNPVDQTQNPGYTAVSITLNAGSTGTVYFCPLSVGDCVGAPSSSKALTISDPTWSSGVLDPTQRYQLIVINGAGSAATYTATSSPNGLPAGTTTIINQGTSQGSTRTIQVVVPQ